MKSRSFYRNLRRDILREYSIYDEEQKICVYKDMPSYIVSIRFDWNREEMIVDFEGYANKLIEAHYRFPIDTIIGIDLVSQYSLLEQCEHYQIMKEEQEMEAKVQERVQDVMGAMNIDMRYID